MSREDISTFIRRLLIENWTPVSGYSPDGDLLIHTGSPDSVAADPQIAIGEASETPRGGTGYDAFRGDGEGFVRRPDGSLDIRCVGGTDDSITEELHPRSFASDLAREVSRILQLRWSGIPDAETGVIEYRNLAPGAYVGPVSDEDHTGRWYAVQEARYVYSE